MRLLCDAEMRVANAFGKDEIAEFGATFAGKRPDILLRNGALVEVKAGGMLKFEQLGDFVNTGRPLLYYFGRTPTSVAQQALAGYTPPIPWLRIPWYW